MRRKLDSCVRELGTVVILAWSSVALGCTGASSSVDTAGPNPEAAPDASSAGTSAGDARSGDASGDGATGADASSAADGAIDHGRPDVSIDAGSPDVSVACSGSQTACGATCVDLQSDPNHCGRCDRACSAALCCSGACVATQACSFAVTSIGPDHGFQNGGEYITLKGSGFAAAMTVYIGDGRAPTRFIDASTALIQAPPGLTGIYDVRVTAGAQTATLIGGYEYRTAGLAPPWAHIPMAAGTVRGEVPAVTVLQDGRVLIAGGTTVPDAPQQSLTTAEIFVRDTQTTTPTAGVMSSPRWHTSAVTLLDGRVLVVGGACLFGFSSCHPSTDNKSADLFDPTTTLFRPTGRLNRARIYTRAVLLPDGRVFVASQNDATFEVYDPTTETFTLIPNATGHPIGFVVRLRDGRVLIGAGDGGVTSAQVFDPDTNTVSTVGSLTTARAMVTANTLPDGRVLVAGGTDNSAGYLTTPQASIEYFDPKTATFTAAPYAMSSARAWHASALVRDGTVLLMGGYTGHPCSSSTAAVDVVDPVQGTVTQFANLVSQNTEWSAVTLLDGSIVGVGGGACRTSQALPDIDFLAGAISE
jgi:hypothetical protein